jgi:hypothetical protein
MSKSLRSQSKGKSIKPEENEKEAAVTKAKG